MKVYIEIFYQKLKYSTYSCHLQTVCFKGNSEVKQKGFSSITSCTVATDTCNCFKSTLFFSFIRLWDREVNRKLKTLIEIEEA